MPALLRITLVLLTSGALFAGIALLALAEVVGTPDGGRLALGSLAVCALALPPMLAGVLASYWSRVATARHRLRVALGLLAAVQLAGAAGLVLLTATRSALLPATVVLVLVAAALDPAVIAIGRAARRIELRDAAPGHDDGFQERVRAGWRRGGIGAAVGLAVGILLCVLLLLPLAGRGDAGSALLFAPAGAGLGASIGMLTVVHGLTGRVRDLLGGDAASSRRIGRAVDGAPEELTDDERVTAARYAAVAPSWLALRTAQSAVTAIALIAIASGSAIGASRDGDAGRGWFLCAVVLLVVGSTLATLFTRRRRLRRVRAYAADHPVGA